MLRKEIGSKYTKHVLFDFEKGSTERNACNASPVFIFQARLVKHLTDTHRLGNTHKQPLDSDVFSAEISLRSPRKLFIFII